VTEPQLPELPDIVTVALPATVEIAPAEAPAAATLDLTAVPESSGLLAPPRPDLSSQPPLPWLAAEVSISAESRDAPTARKHAPPVREPRARRSVPLAVLAFPPLPMGGSAAGGTGVGGTGAVAALAVWMLLQLPGLAVLRLPPSRRSPRARVDDIRNRPG
jgi:hypothetical protein